MKEKKVNSFKNFLRNNRKRITNQRKIILSTLIKYRDKHLSAEDLHHKVQEINPNIGFATVYRTLKLLKAGGFTSSAIFEGERKTKYETIESSKHHDHIICIKCGDIIEFENSRIENIQCEVAKKHNFKIISHKMEIYGICGKCQINWKS